MQHYCTLFNTSYLSRAMVMYDSLVKTGAKFHLYIFAFDDAVFEFFKGPGKKDNITVISLEEFQDEDLLDIKAGRTPVEYCWTCTPSTVLYCLEKFKLLSCTYIDADLFFYSDPLVLLEEMGDKSVMITEHRFTQEYEKGAENGIYCVQFVNFKNDENGLKVLKWWRNSCIEWCYARAEDGKFGDQKYLDDWMFRFEGIHVLKHLGGGVAPWNVQQYSFSHLGASLYGVETSSANKFPVIFFHFHALKLYTDDTVSISNYRTSGNAFELFYAPYVQSLLEKEIEMSSHFGDADISARTVNTFNRPEFWVLLQYYWQDIKTAVSFLFGKNIKKRCEAINLYSLERFKK
jgi:hypothetical protein